MMSNKPKLLILSALALAGAGVGYLGVSLISGAIATPIALVLMLAYYLIVILLTTVSGLLERRYF